ncbi:GNAT family N-acetyltransferase [Caulobacter sp.]|jgi:ribosomal-protein-alanine N-acetyltransferase|uniref:GNAT family N-acetyltransferase n=1 Tax=Caulobacter sp. TaxID=78 RepID=UPI0031D8570D
MTAFQTPRLTIRPFQLDDLDALAAIAGDPAVMRFVGDGQALSRAACAEWIARSRENVDRHGYGTAAVLDRASGALIGWAGMARPLEGGEELIYGLSRAWQRRGLGREILNGLIGAARERGATGLRALIYPDNHASAAMLTRAGFTLADTAYEGEDDTHLYVLELA